MKFGNMINTALATALLTATASSAQAAPKYSEWGMPTAVPGATADGCPYEAQDGKSLYTASRRDGDRDIFVFTRNNKKGEFEGPVKVGEPISITGADDLCPLPLRKDWFIFVSNREGGCGGNDMYITRKTQSGWAEPKNLGCAPEGPNTTGSELGPSLINTKHGYELYYSSDVSGNQDIYKSELELDGSFTEGEAISELNTDSNDQQPSVRKDGREIVFASDRDGAGQDIWSATRDSIKDDWSDFRNLSTELALPSGNGSESRPSLSWDGKRLYYGTAGTVYVSDRDRKRRSSKHDGKYSGKKYGKGHSKHW